VKSADSIVRQSAAHALGQLQAKEAVHELIALLKDETYGLRKRFRLKEASNTINKDNNFNYYVLCCNYPVTWLFVSTYYTYVINNIYNREKLYFS
jgi:hypothetical protein